MDKKEIINGINELYNYHIDFENVFINYLSEFYNEAEKLVTLSNGKYQIEKNIKLNKISIKGYILDSDIIKKINLDEFRLFELKQYLNSVKSDDKYNIMIAIKLYEILDNMEQVELNQISNSLYYIQMITGSLFEEEIEDKGNLSTIYNNLLNIINNYKKSNILNDDLYNKTIYCLNFLFNYYINGSRKIVNNI